MLSAANTAPMGEITASRETTRGDSAPSLIDGSYPFPPSTAVRRTTTVPMKSKNCKALGS